MIGKTTLFWIAALVMTSACNKSVVTQSFSSKDTELSGKIVKMAWTKSTESFCAQGSDYFVLQFSDASDNSPQNRIVLETSEPMQSAQLEKLTGKIVIIYGVIIEKTIQYNKDELSQRPVNLDNSDDSFTCRLFKISSISNMD